jgi:hypothetical protein
MFIPRVRGVRIIDDQTARVCGAKLADLLPALPHVAASRHSVTNGDKQ